MQLNWTNRPIELCLIVSLNSTKGIMMNGKTRKIDRRLVAAAVAVCGFGSAYAAIAIGAGELTASIVGTGRQAQMVSIVGTGKAPTASIVGTGKAPTASIVGTGKAPMASIVGTGKAPMASIVGTGKAPMASIVGTGRQAQMASVTGTSVIGASATAA
jgi:hypothetical protein